MKENIDIEKNNEAEIDIDLNDDGKADIKIKIKRVGGILGAIIIGGLIILKLYGGF